MSPQPTWRSKTGQCRFLLCAILFGAMLCAGCASWQLPRIDPTGESLFIWSEPAPVVMAPPPGAPVVAAPLSTPPVVAPAPPPVAPLPMGNVQAAPVYPDVPAAPLAAPPAIVGPPAVVGPPVVTVPATPAA